MQKGKKVIFEVNLNGELIDIDELSEEEVKKARKEGKHIVTFGWHGKRLFKPKFNFELNDWVEGLSPEEIAERESEINNPPISEIEQLKKGNEMNAIAILELTSFILGGE